MIMLNKAKIFAGLFMGSVLLSTGCVSPGHDFSQEVSVEENATDVSAASEAGSSGAGASATSTSIPAVGGGGGGLKGGVAAPVGKPI